MRAHAQTTDAHGPARGSDSGQTPGNPRPRRGRRCTTCACTFAERSARCCCGSRPRDHPRDDRTCTVGPRPSLLHQDRQTSRAPRCSSREQASRGGISPRRSFPTPTRKINAKRALRRKEKAHPKERETGKANSIEGSAPYSSCRSFEGLPQHANRKCLCVSGASGHATPFGVVEQPHKLYAGCLDSLRSIVPRACREKSDGWRESPQRRQSGPVNLRGTARHVYSHCSRGHGRSCSPFASSSARSKCPSGPKTSSMPSGSSSSSACCSTCSRSRTSLYEGL